MDKITLVKENDILHTPEIQTKDTEGNDVTILDPRRSRHYGKDTITSSLTNIQAQIDALNATDPQDYWQSAMDKLNEQLNLFQNMNDLIDQKVGTQASIQPIQTKLKA